MNWGKKNKDNDDDNDDDDDDDDEVLMIEIGSKSKPFRFETTFSSRAMPSGDAELMVPRLFVERPKNYSDTSSWV